MVIATYLAIAIAIVMAIDCYDIAISIDNRHGHIPINNGYVIAIANVF